MLRKDYIAFIRANAPHITGVHQMRKEKLATIYEELVKQQKRKQKEIDDVEKLFADTYNTIIRYHKEYLQRIEEEYQKDLETDIRLYPEDVERTTYRYNANVDFSKRQHHYAFTKVDIPNIDEFDPKNIELYFAYLCYIDVISHIDTRLTSGIFYRCFDEITDIFARNCYWDQEYFTDDNSMDKAETYFSMIRGIKKRIDIMKSTDTKNLYDIKFLSLI